MAETPGYCRHHNYETSFVPTDRLKPDKRNARKHPKIQIDQLVASIKTYGWTVPILVDEDDNIIAGHGRLLAAKQLGVAEVPVIVLAGLSNVQKQALRIADNKIALNSSWDMELLRLNLEQIVLELPDIEMGLEAGEIDTILSFKVDPDEEAIPAVPMVAVSRTGDVWILGRHRVACGDCADSQVLGRLMQGMLADAAFLDLPYNQPARNIGNKGKIKHRDIAGAAGELTPAQFTARIERWLGACAGVTRDGGVHFVCMDHHHAGELIQAGETVYGDRLNICIWNKSNGGMGALYRSKHEMIFVYRVGTAPHFNAVQLGRHGRNRTNVWDAPSVNTFGGSRRQDLELHPTVKPVKLVGDAIMDVTRRGELVLDAFLGSGTTLIACDREGRVCRGVEIDPAYVDVIIDRFTTITGIEAVLEETGETFDQVRARRVAASGEGG